MNQVQELNRQAAEQHEYLRKLELSSTQITQILDGLPHAPNLRPKLERLTLQIVDTEHELRRLDKEILLTKEQLTDAIFANFTDPFEQALMMLRYVGCYSFKEIGRRMSMSTRQVYRLHKSALKKMSPPWQ